MKIYALNYYDTNLKNNIKSFKPEINTQELGTGSCSVNTLEDFNFAKEYYNNRLDNEGKLFDDEKSFMDIINNAKARKVLFLFFQERAQKELSELNSKTNLNDGERDKKEGLKEIIKAFPAQEQGILPYNPAFQGILTPEQKKKCRVVIHGASAACGGISAALGEGAAVGADTWVLRGTQALMFLYLQNLLNVDPGASLLYMGRQYVMGQYLGVRGAQILISWLGLGGEAATGGSGFGPITGAVRSINSALSIGITEKMGWGYVKSYEQDTMNMKKQLLNSAIYSVTMNILHVDDQNILNTSDYSDIQTALSKVSNEDLSTFGQVIHTLTNTINIPRAASIFAMSLFQGVINTKNLDEQSTKEYFKNMIKTALLGTVLYEIVNIPGDNVISDEALNTLKNIQHEFENTPEVFQEFQNLQQQVFDKLNLENLNSRDFINQFKNKEFVVNLAIATGESTTILADKWRERNFETLKNARIQNNNASQKIQAQSNAINSQLSEEDKQKLNNELNDLVSNIKANMNTKTRANHALERIAGYDGTKSLLNISYIEPVKAKNEKFVPNLLLFYGPSGLGKTAIGSAIAEDAGARFKNRTLGMDDDRKTIDWIRKRLEEGEENYRKSKRFSIIQLNEFDGFLDNNPELLEEFINLIDNSVKKYHTSIFLTTNNPLQINEKILEKVEIKVPMCTASKDDIRDIVKYYVNSKEIEDYNLDEITEEFEKVKPDYMYSNVQIENIIYGIITKKQCSQKDFINAIKSVKPCITKEINDKFENEQKILEREMNNVN